jgi:formate hydrogenlyase transcriptional activator
MKSRPAARETISPNAERYRTLLEITNAIISNLTQEALFHAIAGALRRVVPFDRTAIFLHDPALDVLRLFVLESSLPSTYFVVGLEMAPDASHVGWVFQHGRPFLRRDLARERQYDMEERALADGVRSYVIVPLVARGRTLGVLAVASTKPDQYSEDAAAFLQEAAAQVALAIENMKVYEEIAALNTRLGAAAARDRSLLEINNAIVANLTRDALFHAMVVALRRVVSFDRTAIFLHDPAHDLLRIIWVESALPSPTFQVGRETALAQTPVGTVFRAQRPLVRTDLENDREYPTEEQALADGVRSMVIVPLVVRGQSIGALTVASATPQHYSAADATFLQEVANQVALATENMTAYEEIAALKARLERENVYLQEEIGREHNFVEMVGSSPPLLAMLQKIEQVGPTDSTVLIAGETGTGKELVARAVHHRSARRERPLVKVNCSAISAGLVESELFGHVRGAFTGALERRIGRFELADRGTLFLDEVGDLPLETQVKLLRVLQEREFEAVGSSRTLKVDVRVIAAANRDLQEAVDGGRFRADLFYRLNVFPIEVPPLRERNSDIPQLVMFFLTRFARRFGKTISGVAPATMDRLLRYPWPGNIRELQNVIERAVILSSGPVLELGEDLLPTSAHPEPGLPQPFPAPEATAGVALGTMEAMERGHMLAALERTGWVVEGPKGAARILGLHPNTLRSRMAKLGITRRRHDRP